MHNKKVDSNGMMTQGAIREGDLKLLYGAPNTNGLDGWKETDGTVRQSNTSGNEEYLLYDVIGQYN